MSRFVENLVVIGIAILMACLGLKLGRTEGRAEMKHWQDEWYAAHPAVKEVPTTPTFNGGASVYIVKPGEKCAVISFDQIHYNVDCEPPPPKPQKGSKRRADDMFKYGSVYTPLPIPEKEPAPCISGQERNRVQDVCCPAYLEVNDCSWHHGTNPREGVKPQ